MCGCNNSSPGEWRMWVLVWAFIAFVIGLLCLAEQQWALAVLSWFTALCLTAYALAAKGSDSHGPH